MSIYHTNLMRNLPVICVMAGLLSLSSIAFAQQSQDNPVKFNKIADQLYEITGGSGANGGAYLGEKGVLLIDAKMNEASVNQTLQEVSRLTDKPVVYLVNTHSDGDHVNGNVYLPESVIFIAHANCRQEFFHAGRNGDPSMWNDTNLAPFIPSVTFSDKMDLYLDPGKIELWYFDKGHTTGDLVVYFPDEKVAFVGDQIFTGRPQLIHSYKGGNSFEHVKTLEKMLETIDAERFYSGHSEVLDRDAILSHIGRMKELQRSVADYLENNLSLEQIKAEFSEDQATLVETIATEIRSQ